MIFHYIGGHRLNLNGIDFSILIEAICLKPRLIFLMHFSCTTCLQGMTHSLFTLQTINWFDGQEDGNDESR